MLLLPFALLIVAAFVWFPFPYWVEVKGFGEPAENRKAFQNWVLKGLAVPVFVWIVLNSGLIPRYPPLVSGQLFFPITSAVVLVVAGYWSAATFCRILLAFYQQAEDRKEFVTSSLVWATVCSPLPVITFWLLGYAGGGLGLCLWLLAVTHFGQPVVQAKKPAPSYSRAIARMKFGKYNEAEMEVIKQLEKCEDDFAGWMMLAELYAVHFHDLPSAEQTIHDLCDQPGLHGSQVGTALHKLADWQLHVGENPQAARRTLAEICDRFPGTHLDKMARLRIEHTPHSREEYLESQQTKTFHLPALQDEPEISKPKAPLNRADAAATSNRLVDRLKLNPNDTASREELARVFAEQLGKVQLGLEQLDLLLSMSKQSDAKRAEWLSLSAAWHLQYLNDQNKGREVLEKIIHEYPNTAQGFAAQRRLNVMQIEARVRKSQEAQAARPEVKIKIE